MDKFRLTRRKIINCHAHMINPNKLDKQVDLWRRKGITHTCLSALGPYYGEATNKDIKRAFLKYPDEISGFGYIRLGVDEPDIIPELRNEGFKGIKIHWPLSGYSDKKHFKIYEKAQEYQMPILFHTGYSMQPNILKDIDASRMKPAHLDTIAKHFPSLKIIGAHLGQPWCREAVATAANNPNVYFDLSGGTIKTMPKAFFSLLLSRVKTGKVGSGTFIDENIISKFVYGSDNEVKGTLKFYINFFRTFHIKKDIQYKILFRNMAEILQL